jgi:hypothetical protein
MHERRTPKSMRNIKIFELFLRNIWVVRWYKYSMKLFLLVDLNIINSKRKMKIVENIPF